MANGGDPNAAASEAPEISVETPLGTFSTASDPAKVAEVIATAARPLAAARVQPQATEDIIHTIVNRLPYVCEMLRLAQLNPGDPNAMAMIPSVMRCIKNVSVVVSRLREPFLVPLLEDHGLDQQSMSAEGLSAQLKYLIHRFDDLAVFAGGHPVSQLRSMQTPEQAEVTASMVDGIWGTVDFLERLRAAITGSPQSEGSAWGDVAALRFSDTGQKTLERVEPENESSSSTDDMRCVVIVSPTGELLLVVLKTALMVFGMSTGVLIQTVNYHAPSQDSWTLKRSTAAWSADGRMFAAPSARDQFLVFVCDAISGDRTWFRASSKSSRVISVAWHPSTHILVGTSAGYASVWDVSALVKTGEASRVYLFEVGSGEVEEVSWSPDGSMIATGSQNVRVSLWEATSGNPLRVFAGAGNGLVWWSPDSTKIAAAGASTESAGGNSVFVGDVASGEVTELKVGGNVETAVAWSPDSTRLAIAQTDSNVPEAPGIWDAATVQMQVSLEGSQSLYSDILNILWSPDGSHIATGTRGGILAVYDASNRHLSHLCRGNAHQTNAFSVSWGSVGNELVSSSWDSESGEQTMFVRVYNTTLANVED